MNGLHRAYACVFLDNVCAIPRSRLVHLVYILYKLCYTILKTRLYCTFQGCGVGPCLFHLDFGVLFYCDLFDFCAVYLQLKLSLWTSLCAFYYNNFKIFYQVILKFTIIMSQNKSYRVGVPQKTRAPHPWYFHRGVRDCVMMNRCVKYKLALHGLAAHLTVCSGAAMQQSAMQTLTKLETVNTHITQNNNIKHTSTIHCPSRPPSRKHAHVHGAAANFSSALSAS